MKNEGLKPSQLAELLEINPAGISHILAGRNKLWRRRRKHYNSEKNDPGQL